jgi:hypothetical protein
MFLSALLALGALPEVTVNGHSTSYYVDDVPVFEDMLPENAVLSVKYTYTSEPEPSESATDINNANTVDFIPIFILINLVLVFLLLVLFLSSMHGRRVNRSSLLAVFVFFNAVTLLGFLFDSGFKASAAGDVYVARDSDLTLYDIVSMLSKDENGHPHISGTMERPGVDPLANVSGTGFYVFPGTEVDARPISFYYADKDADWFNWVLFADKCWRIVRTTESGGVKLLYHGEATELGTCESSDPEFVPRPDRSNVFGIDGVDNSDLDIDIDFENIGIEDGFYTYGDINASLSRTYNNRSDRDTFVPSDYYETVSPYLYNYSESSCYKNIISGNFDLVTTSGNLAYCETNSDKLYTGYNVDYFDGEYYIQGHELNAVVPATIICEDYASGCNDSNITVSYSEGENRPKYYYENHLNQIFDYVCTTVDGAEQVKPGYYKCGNSIETYDSIDRVFGKINGGLVFEPYGDKDSIRKKAVENWFGKNMSSKLDMIADDGFCAKDYDFTDAGVFDDVVYTYDDDANFALSCSKNARYTVSSSAGNGKSKYPVGLLTKSEAELMGGFYDTSSSSSNHLYTLFMDSYSYEDFGGNVFVNHSIFDINDNQIHWTGYTNADFVTVSAIPVITLKNSVKAVNGDGSNIKPFIIEGEKISSQTINDNENIKSIRFDNQDVYDYLVSYYSDKGEEYAFSKNDIFKEITVDTSRVLDIDFTGMGLDDVSFLENFKNIRYMYLADNNLTELPNIDYSSLWLMKIENNHISDLGPAKDFVEDNYRENFDNFRQTVEINYSDPDNIPAAPIVEQYLNILNYVSENPTWDAYINNEFLPVNIKTHNMKFNDSLKSGYALDSSLPSYEWIDIYVTYK